MHEEVYACPQSILVKSCHRIDKPAHASLASIIIFATLLFVIEAKRHSKPDLEGNIYSILGTSLLGATALTGITSLAIGFWQARWVHSWMIATLVGLAWIAINQGTGDLRLILDVVRNELRKFGQIGGQSKYLFILIVGFTALTCIASIGPINHPDAANYHAGYPYQIHLRGELFVDGGLTQGLLGLNDYAYIAYFQENLSWLVRSSQVLFLIPLITYLVNKRTNLLIVLAFASSPIFLQWATIGKPLFLAESIVAVAYLTWNSERTNRSAYLLITCSILAICFKISALIIILPITAHLAWSYFQDNKKLVQKIPKLLKSPVICICLASIAITAVIRFYQTDNPLYPLLSDYFTPHDWQKINFESMLKQYNGVGKPFPLSLFLPTSIGYINSALGTGLLIALLFAVIDKGNIGPRPAKLIVGISQLLLLMWIGQKRGDYYATPLIVLISEVKLIVPHFYGLKSAQHAWQFLLAIFQFVALPVQLVITTATSAASISQSILASINYNKTMKRTAYGYQITKELDEYSAGRKSLNYVQRNTKLYSDHGNYIDKDKVLRCMGENHNIYKLPYCMRINQIQTVALSQKNKSDLINSLDKCQERQSFFGARNPFNLLTITYYLCELNDTKS